jgi:hypothetical protein
MKALRPHWLVTFLLLMALTFLLYRWLETVELPEEVKVMVEEFGKLEDQVLEANTLVSKIIVQQEDSLVSLTDLNCSGCLFFRYSELSCKTCVDETITLMKELLPLSFIESKVIVLVESSSPRLTRVFKDINELEGVEVWLTKEPVLEEIDQFYTPYFFQLDEQGKVNVLKIVIQQVPSRTKDFLSAYLQ